MKDFKKLAVQLKKREKDAKSLDELLEKLLSHVDQKMPSYTGKARFIDDMIKAKGKASLLASELKLELEYLGKEG